MCMSPSENEGNKVIHIHLIILGCLELLYECIYLLLPVLRIQLSSALSRP